MRNVPEKNIGDDLTSTEWDTGVMDELKNCIIDTSQSFNNNDNSQLVQSIMLLSANRKLYIEDTGSTGSAYQIKNLQILGDQIKLIQLGMKIDLIITNANSVINPTIQFNGITGTYNIKNRDGSDLLIGAFSDNDIVSLYFNGTDFIVANYIFNQKIINESNYYTAVFSNNNYTLTNSLTNPSSYYNGLIVTFESPADNTSNVTLQIGGLTQVNLVKCGQNVVAGDLLNDCIISAMYYDGSFHVLKSFDYLNSYSDGLFKLKGSGDSNYSAFANTSSVIPITGLSLTLTNNDSFKTYLPTNDTDDTTITIPALSTCDRSCEFLFNIFLQNNQLIINANGTDKIYYNGSELSNVTLSKCANSTFKLKKLSNIYWVLTGVNSASETVSGVSTIATQTKVDTGTDDFSYITAKKLKDTPFIVNLGIVYPVGSTKEFLLNIDPNTLPGYSSFTWERLPNGLIYTTDNIAKIGMSNGTEESVGGGVNPTSLSLSQIPQFSVKINISNTSQIGGGNSIKGCGDPVNTVITQDSIGGGQPHVHELNLRTVYVTKWVRTA